MQIEFNATKCVQSEIEAPLFALCIKDIHVHVDARFRIPDHRSHLGFNSDREQKELFPSVLTRSVAESLVG